jgi:hypothetical protein
MLHLSDEAAEEGSETVGDRRLVFVAVMRHAPEDRRRDRAEQHRRDHVCIEFGAELGDERAGVEQQRPVSAHRRSHGLALCDQREREVPVLELDEGEQEGFEPVRRRCSGTERGATAEEGILEIAHVVADQRLGEPGAVTEAPEHSALAHPGRGGDRIHRQSGRAVLGNEMSRGGEDPLPIGGGVDPLWPRLRERELNWRWDVRVHVYDPKQADR